MKLSVLPYWSWLKTSGKSIPLDRNFMRHSFLLFATLLLLTCQKSEAQFNYVPNPSFEEYDSIPFFQQDSTIYKYAYFAKRWFIPVSCWSYNYFNSKLNFQDTTGSGSGISPYGVPQNPGSYTYPYDGIAQSVFCPFVVSLNEGIRNYLEVKLKAPLIQGHKYCVSFFVTLADSCYIAVDQIGAKFTNDTLQHYNPNGNLPCYILQTPQVLSPQGVLLNIRNQWQNVSGTFIAQGGEQFLTIGNFKTDSNTNYIWLPDISNYGPSAAYHIDMVSVIECDTNIKTVYAGADTSICKGDSVMLGTPGSFPGYAYAWSPGTGLSDSCIQNPMASPLHTTTYILTQTYYSTNTSTDTVTVVTIDSCNNSVNEFYDTPNLRIKVYPNPAKEVVSIEFTNTEINESDIQFEVYDLMGKKLINEILKPYQKTDVSTIGLGQGIYTYKFVYKNKIVKKDKLVIIK